MGIKKLLTIILLVMSFCVSARNTDEITETILGASTNEKFSYYEPSYLIFGEEDLKLQFSFKYRLSKSNNLYFAYTQLMFWEIYGKSKPFTDVNYRPEGFYRLVEKKDNFFSSLDFGYLHLSNGQESDESRSLDRIFLRTSFKTNIKDHVLGGSLMVHQIFNEDDTNKDIINHLGYWELRGFLSDIMTLLDQKIDLHFRTYAGSKVYDLDKGGYELGLIYNLVSADFNPAFYLQRFEGYSESLIEYQKKRTEYRLGIMLSY